MRGALFALALVGCTAASAQAPSRPECTRDRDCVVFHGCRWDCCPGDRVVPRSRLAAERRGCARQTRAMYEQCQMLNNVCAPPASDLDPECSNGTCGARGTGIGVGAR
jgi:hypothetical protein